MAKMSAEALANNLSNPARQYLWEVLFPNPAAGDTETLLLRCQSTSIPERSVGQIVVPFKQSAGVAYPGKLAYTHTWDLVFIEGEDREIFTAFYSWLNKVIDDKANTGDIVVKHDVYLHLLNTDGAVAMRIRMVGLYPMRLSDAPLDFESENPLRFTTTWSFDRWELVD